MDEKSDIACKTTVATVFKNRFEQWVVQRHRTNYEYKDACSNQGWDWKRTYWQAKSSGQPKSAVVNEPADMYIIKGLPKLCWYKHARWNGRKAKSIQWYQLATDRVCKRFVNRPKSYPNKTVNKFAKDVRKRWWEYGGFGKTSC